MDFKKTMDKAIKMYDPIMCMNIPASVKTKDAISAELKKEIVRNGGILDKGKYRYDIDMNRNIIRRIDRKLLGTMAANSGWEVVGKFRDSALDKAIRNCDYAYGTAEIKDVNGKWVVYRSGKYVQEFDTSEDAEAFVREKRWR